MNSRNLLRGLWKGLYLLALAAVLSLPQSRAQAASGSDAQTGNSPGDIIVSATGADGGAVKGFHVRVILPGPDGSLEKAPNILFEATDGGEHDADGARNGAVAFLSDDVAGYVGQGQGILIDITAAGYVPVLDLQRTYSEDSVNDFSIELRKQKTIQK